MLALGNAYTRSYGKTHLTITKCKKQLQWTQMSIQTSAFKQPPQAMPDEYKNECSIEAYWNYYIGEKHTVANQNEKVYEQKASITFN